MKFLARQKDGKARARSADPAKLRLYVLLAFIAAVALMGGASRADVVSLIVLRPLALLAIAAAVLLTARQAIMRLGLPFRLLLASMVLLATFLIPIPFDIWAQLPGRQDYASALIAVGATPDWVTLGLSPTRTLNALFALCVPLAAMLLFAGVGRENDERVALALVAVAAFSALLAILQQVGDPRGALYPYRLSNFGAPIGFFANRNHQAVTLAAMLPLLAHVAMQRGGRERSSRVGGRALMAGAVAALFAIVIAMSGSRAGFVGIGLGLVLSIPIIARRWPQIASRREKVRPRRSAIWAGTGIVAAAFIALPIFAGQSLAVQRLIETNAIEERRVELLPNLFAMVRDFFPLGSGFGTFDLAYYRYETLAVLDRYYVNQAHNDWLQVAIEGGVVGIALLAIFVAWFARQALDLWRADDASSRWSRRFAALSLITIYGFASLVDYPLRTPLAATIFALACVIVVRKDRY